MIDLTIKLSPNVFVWWGDRPFEITTDRYGDIRVSSLSMSLHTGTHIDLPQHYGFDETDVPDVWIGVAEVIELGNLPDCGNVEAVFVKTGQGHMIESGEINTEFKSLSVDYVMRIHSVCENLEFLGVDAPSVDVYGSDSVHKYLLSKGIFIVESLKISKRVSGKYRAVIAPLKIKGVEAYPSKVFLLEEV